MNKFENNIVWLSAISLFLFLLLLFGVVFNFINNLDTAVHSYFLFLSSSNIARAAGFVTSIADTITFVIASLILLIFLFAKKRYSKFYFSLFSLASGSAILVLFKVLVHRIRPAGVIFAEEGFSFPSGHAFKITLFLLVLWFAVAKDFKSYRMRNAFVVIASLLILVVGISRIIMGVHWLSDVIAGFLLAFLWFGLCVIIFERFKK
jgi:undecaprenyl-diphosphatase